jgi:hypothetical protein
MSIRDVIRLLYFDHENYEDARRAADLEALTPRWRQIFAERAAKLEPVMNFEQVRGSST